MQMSQDKHRSRRAKDINLAAKKVTRELAQLKLHSTYMDAGIKVFKYKTNDLEQSDMSLESFQVRGKTRASNQRSLARQKPRF